MPFNKLRRDVQCAIEGFVLVPDADVDKVSMRLLLERTLVALGGPVADERVFAPRGTSLVDLFKKELTTLFADAINGSGAGPEDISAENRLQMGAWAEVEEEAGSDAMLSPATCSSFEGIGVPHSTAPHPPTEAEWTDIGRAPLPVGHIDISE